MSTVDAIGTSTQTNQSSSVSGLTSDEYFELIFAELTNQDPLEPQDTSALLEQVSAIRAIESDEALADRLTDLVGQNEFASAAALIGRSVSGLDESNFRATGVVDSVSKTESGVVVNLEGGTRVPMATIDEVLPTDESADREDAS